MYMYASTTYAQLYHTSRVCMTYVGSPLVVVATPGTVVVLYSNSTYKWYTKLACLDTFNDGPN